MVPTQPRVFIHCAFFTLYRTTKLRMIEWCFTPLSTVYQSYHSDSSRYSCLSWVSPVLGWALKCLPQGHSCKKPRGSSAARTQDPWITSQTINQSATQDPMTKLSKSKFKAFAVNNINVTENLKYVLKWVKNIVGTGEHTGYQHFLLFQQCF